MKLHPSLSDDLAAWAQRQPIFITGSAPTHGAHVNVSPKGLSESHFAVIGPNQCAYIDRTGSGCETIAHSYENGRLCLMFMSFGNSPRIMRLFCRSRVVEWDQPEFPSLLRQIARGKREAFDAARAVILCDIWQVQTSCGFGVPRVKKSLYAPNEGDEEEPTTIQPRQKNDDAVDELAVFEERPNLDKWGDSIAEQHKMEAYQRRTNVHSLDGLPGLKTARRGVGQRLWVADAQAALQRLWAQRAAVVIGAFLGIFSYVAALYIYAQLNVHLSV